MRKKGGGDKDIEEGVGIGGAWGEWKSGSRTCFAGILAGGVKSEEARWWTGWIGELVWGMLVEN